MSANPGEWLVNEPDELAGSAMALDRDAANETMVAVVPVKNLESAKQRLAGAMGAAARRRFYVAMLEDVLSVLASVPSLSGVLVVTRDRDVRRLATRYGAECLVEIANDGHTQAVRRGAGALAERGAHGLIQVPGDIPLITVADIETILRAHAAARVDGSAAVTLVPSFDKRGTNAVVCSPPDVFPFRFGDDSFYPHVARSRELGIEPTIVENKNLSVDVDTPADLDRFRQAARPCRALRVLNTVLGGHNDDAEDH